MKITLFVILGLALSVTATAQNLLPDAPSISTATQTKDIAHPRIENALVWGFFTAAQFGDTYTTTHNHGCVETNPLYGTRNVGKFAAVEAAEQGAALLVYFVAKKTAHGKARRIAYILPLALGAQHAFGGLHNYHNGCS